MKRFMLAALLVWVGLLLGAPAVHRVHVRQQEHLAFQCLMNNWDRTVGQAWAFCLDSVLPPDHDWLTRNYIVIGGKEIEWP